MKRGTPGHPKTLALMQSLGIDLAKACGTLELLWHFAARYAPRGDIGRWPDEEIAKAVHWLPDDGPPGELISALVQNGWIDSDKTYRLLVHDWADHCEQSVKKFLARNKLRFASKSGRRPSRVHPQDSLPLPLPVPEPEPTEGDTRARATPAPPPPEPAPPPPEQPAPAPAPGPPPSPGHPTVVPPPQWPDWLAPYGEVYHAAYGRDSEPPWGEMNQSLAPLVEKHDHAIVLARWTRFVRSKADASWCRPRRFVESFGQFETEQTALATTGAGTQRKPTASEITANTMRQAIERDRKRGGEA